MENFLFDFRLLFPKMGKKSDFTVPTLYSTYCKNLKKNSLQNIFTNFHIFNLFT